MSLDPDPGRVLRRCIIVGVATLLVVGVVSPARAELVTFSTGRTMSIGGHRQEGSSFVFSLRSGGEMVVDVALIAAINPDEVPYPEPPAPVTEPERGVATAQPLPTLAVNTAFDPIIRRLAAENGVDASLVRAMIQVESGYQPRARSSRGAVGLMQVMPATARQYGITNLYDPSTNIRAGITHLKTLLDRFPLALALAAYNAGEGAVERFAGVPPYPETVKYVSTIRALLGR